MMEVVSGDNWSYRSCKAPVKSSPPTNQHATFYRLDACTQQILSLSLSVSLSLSILTTIFQVPCLAGFIEAKDDGGGEW